VMQEVEALCDKVVIIHKGGIVAQDLLANLKSSEKEVILYLETQEKLEEAWFLNMQGISQIQMLGDGHIQLATSNAGQLRKEIMDLVQKKDLSLISLRQEERNLETIFHQLTGTTI